jgi:UDP-N-acetylmuramate dehydrogenase
MMNQYKNISIKLSNILGAEDIAINEPMKNHTSFKVGGPTDILVSPNNYEQVVEVIKLCNEYKIPFYVIGKGSNLVVRDGGYKGVIVKLTKLSNIAVNREMIVVQCGADLCRVSDAALENDLTGFEFACGIPGTVGGAVTMNAGAYNGEVSEVIYSALLVDKEGNLLNLDKEQLELGYRTSAVQKHSYTVLEVNFKLIKGDHEKIKNRIDELTRRREEKQPLEYPSAGSTFKRPEGHFTGQLIEECALKGYSIGGAEVSEKHAGFIINKGGASAKDVLSLIAYVQTTVKERFGVELQPEIRIIGEE